MEEVVVMVGAVVAGVVGAEVAGDGVDEGHVNGAAAVIITGKDASVVIVLKKQ
ncbi:Hypothetical predicted protein [Olea europaea subsp. europaea]|uniref:Uncharacterized protein n=1 Tax=Olea europaea subsp. europaea TaxID=158383 RepID=A0A8S0V7G2_OLEEU|nr:Hypothetical predicted protein [Olea europaea subsp. europaea]